jgi:hypothetical protein
MSARARSIRAAELRTIRRRDDSRATGGPTPDLDSFGFYAAAPLVDRFFTLAMESAEAAAAREVREASVRPIHVAAARGDPRAVIEALKCGADVNETVGGAVFNGQDFGADSVGIAKVDALTGGGSTATTGTLKALRDGSSAEAAAGKANGGGTGGPTGGSGGSSASFVLTGAKSDNGTGWNAGHFACAAGHIAVLRELCGRGLQINAQDTNGWTALHLAAANGHADCARELIVHGAVVHLRSTTGNTALHLAARAGHAACIRELIMGGVRSEVEARNGSGQTAREVARRYCLVEAGDGPVTGQFRDTMLVLTVDVIDAAKRDKDRAMATMSSRYRPSQSQSQSQSSQSSQSLSSSQSLQSSQSKATHHHNQSSKGGSQSQLLQGALALGHPHTQQQQQQRDKSRPQLRPRERSVANGSATPVDEQVREWNAFRFDQTTAVMAKLREFVAGQTIAVRSIANAFQRREAAAFPGDFPLVFVFVGGSGCGKRQLSLATAEFAFPNDDAKLHVIDMTRFLRKEAAVDFEEELCRILGLPKHRKASDPPHRVDAVIHLKDIDRAHSEVFRPLRATFRDGRVTDGAGATVVTCTRSVFVMTVTDDAFTSVIRSVCTRHPISSTASQLQRETRDHVLKDEFQRDVREPLAAMFRFPEIAREVSDILPFLPYDRPELVAIATTQLRRQQRLIRATGIRVKTEPGVLDFVIAKFVGKRGIRAIEDAIDADIVRPIRDAIKGGRIARGDTVTVEPAGKILRLRVLFKINVPKNLCNEHEFYLN